MSQESKIQILNQICHATQEKAQNLEKLIVRLKEVDFFLNYSHLFFFNKQMDLLKLQNSNLIEELSKLKETMRVVNEESDFLRKELKIYKSHIFNISSIFDTLSETGENFPKKFIDEFRLYLEKNFLDKLSDSVFFEEVRLGSDKKRSTFSLGHINNENLISISENKGSKIHY